MTRPQLLALGLSREAIAQRLATGRLHLVSRGIYAVGRPELTDFGRWMAAVLACGQGAVLSHESAAVLWDIWPRERSGIEVSVPLASFPRRPDLLVHRRKSLDASDVTRRRGIPVTRPITTLLDMAARLEAQQLEALVNDATSRGLTDPESLRTRLGRLARRPGVRRLRAVLDQRTFRLTDSELERRFLPLARGAGLPLPETRRVVNGFRVDFFWPALGLVVETDGLRYHRTPTQQSRDRLRDQVHTAAGLTTLRFTHEQVRFHPQHVEATLGAVARGLTEGNAGRGATGGGRPGPP